MLAVSAKHGSGVDDLKKWLLGRLPYGPAYYPKVNPFCNDSCVTLFGFIWFLFSLNLRQIAVVLPCEVWIPFHIVRIRLVLEFLVAFPVTLELLLFHFLWWLGGSPTPT